MTRVLWFARIPEKHRLVTMDQACVRTARVASTETIVRLPVMSRCLGVCEDGMPIPTFDQRGPLLDYADDEPTPCPGVT
jgi:hypothetical protein